MELKDDVVNNIAQGGSPVKVRDFPRKRESWATAKAEYNENGLEIEGTLSQGVRAFELRRSRYIGLAKTHVQHVATAAAINLARLADWFSGIPKAQTRQSTFATLAASVYI